MQCPPMRIGVQTIGRTQQHQKSGYMTNKEQPVETKRISGSIPRAEIAYRMMCGCLLVLLSSKHTNNDFFGRPMSIGC